MKPLTTLGEFVVDVAYGKTKQCEMSEASAQQARHDLSVKMADRIEAIRTEQRKAFENTKSVMVF